MDKKIGKQIRKLRGKVGLTLHEASHRARMSITQWWSIEQGRVDNPGIETIEKMKKVVGMK